MLPFARPSWAHLIPLLLALTLLPAGAPAQVPATSGDAAVMTQSRWGHTPRGDTRVVFQFDRAVDFFTAELTDGSGFDLHLLGANPASAPAPLSIGDGTVTRVVFRPGASGTVARIEAPGGVTLIAKAFTLQNPHRIVVDVKSDQPAESRVTPRKTTASPQGTAAPTEKSYKTVPTSPNRETSSSPVASSAPKAPEKKPDTKAEATIFESADAKGRAPAEETEFQDLLGWIHRLRTQVDALNFSESEPERTKYRRSLAYLLAERGILVEAERALTGALASPSRVQATAFADSIYLAELRIRIGRTEEAGAVARNLDLKRATPQERVRVARVLVESNLSNLAGPILDGAVSGLSPVEGSRASLLRARCHWDVKEIPEAHKIVQKLTTDPKTGDDVLASALVLHADCVWALGRPQDAKGLYERAAKHSLDPEEASWTTLQLGNLAHREGRIDDAKALYRTTIERWPDSFYAPQADWFLRLTEQAQKLQAAEVAQRRG